MISVVIVSKGERPDELKQCLTSLSMQTFKDFEVILVFPKKRSVEKLFELAKTDLHRVDLPVRLIHQDGEGICNARNCGIKASKGDIIAFTDDDSEPYADWLGKIFEKFSEDSKLDYLGGDFTLEPRNIWQQWINNRYHLSEKDVQRGLCHGNNMAYRHNVLLKESFNENITFGADESDLQERLHQQGFKGKNFDDILIKHGHRFSFASFTRMRWSYAQGKAFLHEKKGLELFHWKDLLNILLLTSIFYALLTTFILPWLWTVPTFLFAFIALHERKQGTNLILLLIDIYVEMLWTLSKMYYSLKLKLRRWIER